MKIFYQVIIIIFVILSLFIIKDDVLFIYNKSISFLKDFKDDTLVKIKNNYTGNDKSEFSNLNQIKSEVNYPGALRVDDHFLTDHNLTNNLDSKRIVEYTNKNRHNNGNLLPLKSNSRLDISAKEKMQDMFTNQYFDHISKNGISVSDLSRNSSYDYILIGENLALGNFKNEEVLLDAWMNSPGHRANILNSRYADIGVSVKKGFFEGKNVWIAVQHFGLSKDVCPSIDELFGDLIKLKEKEIIDMESDLIARKAIIDKRVLSNGKSTNEQISDYNILVNNYNKMIIEIKNQVNKYNEQVNNFNLCVENILK